MHPGIAPTTLNASGNGSVRISPEITGLRWIIRQVCISCTPMGNVDVETNVDGFTAMSDRLIPTPTCADGDPPIAIEASEYLEFQFTAGPANGQIIVSYFYDEEQVV